MTDRGGIALTTLAAGLLVAAVAGLVIGVVADIGVAAARARTAADAAALAGAGASPLVGGRGDPCAQARVLAAANGATLHDCGIHPGRPGTVVEVTVEAAPRLALTRAAPPVTARAFAAVRPAG